MKKFWAKNARIIMPAIIAILGGYTGYGEYQKRQETPSVTVNVESMPTSSMPDVDRIVRQAIESHKRDYH